MTAPLGVEVGMTLDTTARIREADYVRSATSGRTYLVTRVHTVSKGPNAGQRQRLRAVVVPEDHPEPGDQVFEFTWYRRGGT
ncbi:hypothetical protein OEB99_16580 [Actinotalea sp. M2MS4P-6]|uniref:hypothetical protein n=1 Tax=Actinotalea sp. M2MS4P-6 TaxID=2983762 RepID=UPI0021E46BB4|nr:hypothetical protein [Actinotalea sp. M2MS4P-6]MCV2395933.1 hypothetical protein [Actinotalea sp. M2MS4P-6]